MYYFATPHAKTKIKSFEKDNTKLDRNKIITNRLEKEGIELFFPQRDTDQTLPGKDILDVELEAIRRSEGIVVALSDTRGIYIEAGYAKALGKRVIGLKVEESREMSDWGYAFFDFVASNVEELIKYLKNLPR